MGKGEFPIRIDRGKDIVVIPIYNVSNEYNLSHYERTVQRESFHSIKEYNAHGDFGHKTQLTYYGIVEPDDSRLSMQNGRTYVIANCIDADYSNNIVTLPTEIHWFILRPSK